MASPGRLRRDIQGLRAIAVVSVVLYHAGVRATSGGYVGVDVFFVISGFLITGLLWQEIDVTGRLSFAAFYARRARRLLPAALLVVVATTAGAAALLSPLRARDTLPDAVATIGYVANYRFAAAQTDYLGAHTALSPFQHYWSLGVEEQFYLLWPLLLFLVAHRRRRRHKLRRTTILVTLLAGASFGLSVWLTRHEQPWAFFSLPTRVWELAAGALVALASTRLRRLPAAAAAPLAWAGLVAIGYAVMQLSDTTLYPGTAATVPVLGAAAVIAGGCAAPRWGPEALLRLRPLQWGGTVSYSWYLWHWPLLVLAPAALGHPLDRPTALGLALGSALLAAATYHLVEHPARRWSWAAARPGRALSAGAVLMSVALLVTAGSLVQVRPLGGTDLAAAPLPLAPPSTHPAAAGVPDPALTEALTAAVTTTAVPANLEPPLDRAAVDKPQPYVDGCEAQFTESQPSFCRYGDADAPTVLLYGDSHVTQWFPALVAAAEQLGYQVETATKSVCPPIALTVYEPVLRRDFHECDRFRERVLQRIAEDPPALVIMGVARHYGPEYGVTVYSTEWNTALADVVREIRADGSPVLMLGPTPHPGFDVPECLSGHWDDVQACAVTRAAAVDDLGEASERAAVEEAGASYVDIVDWVCTPVVCPPVVGNLLVYRDDNHLAREYVGWLTPVVTTMLAGHLPPAMPGPA